MAGLIVLLTAAGCQDSKASCESDGPPPLSAECAYMDAKNTCRVAVLHFGLEAFADEVGARTTDPETVARRWAKDHPTFHDEAINGCVDGIREATAE